MDLSGILTPNPYWFGGAFDASGSVSIHKIANGRRVISLRVNGPAAPAFKEAVIGGSFTKDFAYFATDNVAYKVALDLEPVTIVQQRNLRALIKFYETMRPLGYQLRIFKRWKNHNEITEINRQRENAYSEFIREYKYF